MVISEHKLFKPAAGAALAVLCGLALWGTRLGEGWVNASYDNLFRFGARRVTNEVVVVLITNAVRQAGGQPASGTNWGRPQYAQLLKKLTAGGCPLVVFDVLFDERPRGDGDLSLAEAMREHGRVVLMAGVTKPEHPQTEAGQSVLPDRLFVDAATNWGIGDAQVGILQTARRHSPFPTSEDDQFQSLPWVAAKLAGAKLSAGHQERWLRYYGDPGPWERIRCDLALAKGANYFHGKTVFIGGSLEDNSAQVSADDKFRTPYTSWNDGQAVGGVELMVTAFLNLVNGDWLRRPPPWLEVAVLLMSGLLLGGGFSRVSPLVVCALALVAGLLVTFAAAWLSIATNYWFPWLVIVGGQVPCALAWALVGVRILPATTPSMQTVAFPPPASPGTTPPPPKPAEATELEAVPETPDYELFRPHFAEGAYGKVWVVRNAIGQWQALKAVYLARFQGETSPYEREFNGIRRYKPISDRHAGLLRIDFISTPRPEGYFYYVMELGDSREPGWEQNPPTYKPRDLASACEQCEGKRLPVRECVRIGLALSEALEFLHGQGLTHRDIKPRNIIFVNGQPKLADVGLVAEIPPPGKDVSLVGTPGYMPPWPEPPGTPRADIFGLGMVLYVVLTGHNPEFFPEITATLLAHTNQQDFIRLNAVILKACQPDITRRFATAAEMRLALFEVQSALGPKIP